MPWIFPVHRLLLPGKVRFHQQFAKLKYIHTQPSEMSCSNLDEALLNSKTRQLAPLLSNDKHKGEAGRIGVFGGSLEYTGAPYFAAISALKVGADLVHVFCAKEAASVIKSYSPELIVHPLLNEDNAIEKITPWLERLHVILIGPGLGREPVIFKVVEELIQICRNQSKPLVIDADGLFLISQKPQIIMNYPHPGAILTPNAMEYGRFTGKNTNEEVVCDLDFGPHVTVLRKGQDDLILKGKNRVKVTAEGTGRRCGGQGDLLSGSLATFFAWALKREADPGSLDDRAMVACYAACQLTRKTNVEAFQKKGRGMVCSDMIEQIHSVFHKNFETDPKALNIRK